MLKRCRAEATGKRESPGRLAAGALPAPDSEATAPPCLRLREQQLFGLKVSGASGLAISRSRSQPIRPRKRRTNKGIKADTGSS